MQQEELAKKFVGQSAGDLFDYFNKQEGDLSFEHEPPGVLSAISFVLEKNLRIEIRLKNSSDLFSERLKWDMADIRAHKIREIKLVTR